MPLADTPSRGYTSCARAIVFRQTGGDTMAMDERRKMTKEFEWPAGRPRDGFSCATAYGDLRRALTHCVLTYAREHPARGYPASVRDVQACLADFPGITFDGDTIASETWRYTYAPGRPVDRSGHATNRGVIETFTIVDRVDRVDRGEQR